MGRYDYTTERFEKSAYAASGVNLAIYALTAVLYRRGNTSMR